MVGIKSLPVKGTVAVEELEKKGGRGLSVDFGRCHGWMSCLESRCDENRRI